jgi:hypothetical protein
MKLIDWTLDHGHYSLHKSSRMKFIRLVEVFNSPYTFCSTDIKTPKIRKVYFQVVVKAKVVPPTKEEDIELTVRIVEAIMEHVNGDIKYTYHVGVDKTMSGLPNDVKDWVEVRTLDRKKVSKSVVKDAELPPGAEIVDMKWGYWLAEFIKLYHLNLEESMPSFENRGPELREAILEELYGEESAGRFRHNSMPADQSLLWAGIDHSEDY